MDHTNSLKSGNDKDTGEMSNSILIEAGVTKNNKTVGQLKYDYVYLFNNVKIFYRTNL